MDPVGKKDDGEIAPRITPERGSCKSEVTKSAGVHTASGGASALALSIKAEPIGGVRLRHQGANQRLPREDIAPVSDDIKDRAREDCDAARRSKQPRMARDPAHRRRILVVHLGPNDTPAKITPFGRSDASRHNRPRGRPASSDIEDLLANP